MKNLVLIVAAGRGKRFGAEVPKQYMPLGAETVLLRTIRAFMSHSEIDAVRVVISEEDQSLYTTHILNLGGKLLAPAIGGAERQDSVRLGLESLRDLKPQNVLIHDAARPFVSTRVIGNILNSLKDHDAVIPVINAKDSARYKGEVIDREGLKLVQTPQGFDYQVILKAHQAANKTYTDDAQVAESVGAKIHFVEGDEMNVKITTKSDIKEQISSFRVGMGFDVHEFETGTHVNICGIKIAHSHQLKGHSDADVGLHALVDAILGAIGEGDIGEHFPPSDIKWRNADSAQFVEYALKLVRSKNAEISNVDITIICEEPKLTPFKALMKDRVASILQLSLDCVNIKATTTEKLGFTGRKEGIASQAVATIKFFG